MKGDYTIIIFSVFLIFLASCAQKSNQINPEISAISDKPDGVITISDKPGQVIEITSLSFAPNVLTIKSGETVNFINKDSDKHWPASAKHPTHEVYPEQGGCIASKFDSCKGLEKDEIFAFKFDVKGTWKYHDHLNPSLFGTIIVE